MDLAYADLLRASIAELRKLKLGNPADERARVETIERLTRELDGFQWEFRDLRPITKQGRLIP
jgi:hypothetical protein